MALSSVATTKWELLVHVLVHCSRLLSHTVTIFRWSGTSLASCPKIAYKKINEYYDDFRLEHDRTEKKKKDINVMNEYVL